ncbi:MAG: aminodeoxychorismate synthase component I [bacterium]|nr:aminodeoxychorismate synthase component I [bacterium]
MKTNRLINPIIKEIPMIDPVRVFNLFKDTDYPFFLDSGMNKYGLGRYSFIGFEPFLVFKSRHIRIEIFEQGKRKQFEDNPYDALRILINQYKLQPISGLPSFIGGAVGYFGYEMRHLIEDVPGKGIDDLDIPDCIFCFYDVILIFDHLKRKAYISSSGFPEINRLREIKAKTRLKEMWTRLSRINQEEAHPIPPFPSQEGIIFNFSREQYLKAIRKVKEYIAAGDIYQVNLSQRLTADLFIPEFELYKRLRELSPAPFACFLDLKDVIIAGASPERFLQVEGRNVITRPIKGTRPRGKTKAEDLRLKNELKTSQKDKAELIMIVDLLRNDLGRVCEFGKVSVKELIKLETHPTLFHTVSIIEGKLKKDTDRFDLLKACFPGGSVTGAPKIRAMEIIDELEPTKRHVYTGTIGYLSFTQSMDLNIAIRTFVIKNNKAHFHIGGGIVADSLPEDEYQETLHKGKALIEALRG